MKRIFLFLLYCIFTASSHADSVSDKYYTFLNMCDTTIYHFDKKNLQYQIYSKVDIIDRHGKVQIKYGRLNGLMDEIGDQKFHLSSSTNMPADVDFSHATKVHIENDTGEAFLTPCEKNQAKALIDETNQWLEKRNSNNHNFATN